MNQQVTVTFNVNPDWIQLVMGGEIFRQSCSGYWIYGVDYDQDLGWLCYEHDEKISLRNLQLSGQCKEALSLWQAKEELPPGWHRLTHEHVMQAFAEGCKRWGADWYETGYNPRYDIAIQLAVLGEIKYG